MGCQSRTEHHLHEVVFFWTPVSDARRSVDVIHATDRGDESHAEPDGFCYQGDPGDRDGDEAMFSFLDELYGVCHPGDLNEQTTAGGESSEGSQTRVTCLVFASVIRYQSGTVDFAVNCAVICEPRSMI
jgi:hypothetical protein